MPEMTEELPEESVKRIEEPAISLKKIAQLEADLEGMEKGKDIEMSRWTAKIAQIKADLKIAKLEADLVDERERNRELERKIAETKRMNKDLEAQLSDPNTEVRDGKAKIGELNGKIAALQSKNSGLETQIESVRENMVQIEANLMQEIAKLEADLVNGRERNRELERKIAETKGKNDGLEAQLREQNTEVKEGKANIGELEGKINALQSKISGFETQIEFERENKTVEIANLQADLNRTMTFLDLDGWSYLAKNAWYKVIDQKMTFDEAVAYCASRKSHLVSIHSQVENDFLRRFSRAIRSKETFWFGLKRNPNKGSAFEWTDGSAVDFTNWGEGEPDSGTHAALHGPEGKWTVHPPTNTYRFICKRSYKF
ncbi:unnamed protein product, partial [Mesorhabditis belari]|uniref:C-type lectin domain-containing protein n=1 Tax=Mesorhabditis belari TaxID=2138241 RepID=A0AAF3EQ72_9BILA